MRIKSAGILLFRRIPTIQVLIVHPSGNYNRNAAWSLPKGLIEENELPEEAARREVLEEIGIIAPTQLKSLGEVIYKSGKQVYAFYGEIETSIEPVLNWEIDKAEFFSLNEAEKLLLLAQQPFIQRLKNALRSK